MAPIFVLKLAGTTGTIELGFSLINERAGQLLFASHPPAGEQISLDPIELITGKQIRGSWGGATRPDIDVPLLSKLVVRNKVPLMTLTKDKFPLEDINKAIDLFKRRKIIRPIIVTV